VRPEANIVALCPTSICTSHLPPPDYQTHPAHFPGTCYYHYQNLSRNPKNQEIVGPSGDLGVGGGVDPHSSSHSITCHGGLICVVRVSVQCKWRSPHLKRLVGGVVPVAAEGSQCKGLRCFPGLMLLCNFSKVPVIVSQFV
jgi:hypothetical protein